MRGKTVIAVPILGFGQGQESLEVHLRPSLTRTCAGRDRHRIRRRTGAREISTARITGEHQ